MGTIITRLGRLEQRRGTADQRQAQNNADAAWVKARIAGLATAPRENRTSATPADRHRWNLWSANFLAETGCTA